MNDLSKEIRARRSAVYRSDYAGPRTVDGTVTAAAIEAVRRRLHEAMLTMSVQPGDGPRTKSVFWPDYIQQFADRVGEEKRASAWAARFTPTGPQIDDMLPALELLEGLRVEYFELVYAKAIQDHFGAGATWQGLGGLFGRSDYWAKDAFNRAILHAAARSKVLPPVKPTSCLFAAGVIMEGVFICYIGSSTKPKQTLHDIRAKNALDIADAFAVWTPGPPVTARLLEATRALYKHRRLRPKGGWYRAMPLDVEDTMLTEAEKIRTQVRMEYLL